MRAFAKDLPRQRHEIKKVVFQEVVIQIVGDTPVRSGRARCSWFPTTGAPDTTSGKMEGEFDRSGAQSLARLRRTLSAATPGEPMFVANNLPYIDLLNNGYSAQAPANFVEIATARGKQIIAKQRIRYGV